MKIVEPLSDLFLKVLLEVIQKGVGFTGHTPSVKLFVELVNIHESLPHQLRDFHLNGKITCSYCTEIPNLELEHR